MTLVLIVAILFMREMIKATMDYFQFDYVTKTTLLSLEKETDYPIISLIFYDEYPFIAQEYYRRIHNMSLYDPNTGLFDDEFGGVNVIYNLSLGKQYYSRTQYLGSVSQAQLILEMHNLTVSDLFNRDLFSKHFWNKSNIDYEQFVEHSSSNYSIGYYFQNFEQVGPKRFDHFRMFAMLSIKPQLYRHTNMNKVLI